MINKTDRKLIAEYVELRGNGQPQYVLSDFIHIYENASLLERGTFKKEMLKYKQAIKLGKIVSGQELKETRVSALPSVNDDQ